MNIFSLLQAMPLMEAGLFGLYNGWLQKNGLQNSRNNQIEFWLQNNGVSDKFNWFWLAEVAKKLGRSPIDPVIQRQFYPGNGPVNARKLNLEALNSVIPRETVYQEFWDYMKPGGTMWQLYKYGKAIDLYVSKHGVTNLSFHSGILNNENFLLVPDGDPRKMIERTLRKLYPEL